MQHSTIKPKLNRRRASVAGLAPLALLALLGAGCNSSDGTGPSANIDFSPAVVAVGANVVYPTYVELAAQGALLEQAVVTLSTSPTELNLTAARDAWRDTRKPWEQSEGFLFGPVDSKGIDPAIDSWPLNPTDLNNVLSSSDSLTKAYVDNLDDNLKGFHTIEYLLFGTNGAKAAADLTVRERAYLVAATASFKGRVDLLKSSWDPAGENFLSTFQTAGNGSAVYISAKSAAEELVDGMIGICDEVANGKISDPFDQTDATLEESRFSKNSTTDFADNLRSVRNVYLGAYASVTGLGVKSWVSEADSALALRVEAEIDSAISKILQMGEFTTAMTARAATVEAARGAIQTVQLSLEGDVKAAIFP